MDYLAAILLLLTGIFLILLVLVQRGRGGGLAGAFGGMGGQSAFGTKAGDVFTWMTAGTAVVWVVLAGLSILAFQANSGGNFGGGENLGPPSVTAGAEDEAGTADQEESIGDDESETSEGTEGTGAESESGSGLPETSSNESTVTPPADESAEKPE